MFTGITSAIGTVAKAVRQGDIHVTIDCPPDFLENVETGASIACSGCCLTVVDHGAGHDGGWFAVDVSEETESCTAQGMWTEGKSINLERALKVGDELGGHIVTGHVDGIGGVLAFEPAGDSHRLTISLPSGIAALVAAKGSITVDGVSLTVNTVEDAAEGARFTLNIIPHTAQVTTLGKLTVGQAVNLEIDILARYLARMQGYPS